MRNHLTQLVALAGTPLPRPRRRRAGRTSAAAAFTLIEVIIAVGAVALVGVALAAVFEVTGRTVTGGRRVAAFNAYAAMIENQMRADFNAMSRSGFIVIRNEFAGARPDGDTPPIPLTPDDATGGRPRRIDQIMFFAEGDFASAREPIHPDFIARGKAARIYYGHGTRLAPDPSGVPANDPYYTPSPADRHVSLALGEDRPNNPNRYAFDWTLLRHVTLLSPPMTAERPGTLPPDVSADEALDSDLQIALQPASSHIFRSLSKDFPTTTSPLAWEDVYNPSEYPRFRSGLIDIATTDLSEIRNIVTTASAFPENIGPNFFDPAGNTGPDEGSNTGMDGQFRPLGEDPNIVFRVHEWMMDAMPAPASGFRPDQPGQRRRMRYEPAPTNLLGVLSDPGMSDLERSYRRADQLMLAASNFLPHCTEFIVEWSFGDTFPSDPNHGDYREEVAGQYIWYGMPRYVGLETGAPPPTDPEGFYARPYGSGDIYWGEVSGSSYNPFIKRTPYRTRSGLSGQFPVDPALIHGPNADLGNAGGISEPVLTSYFGYVNPTFNPSNPGDGPGAANNSFNDPSDSATGTIPWAWPKLFRVTLTLADPSDPTYEQTFQFVFDAPAGQDR